MASLELGEKYYLRYRNWHVDPIPYLYVVYRDRKLVEGYNLHYLPNIRFNIPIEVYRKKREKYFQEAYDNMTEAGHFKGLIRMLDYASANYSSHSQFRKLNRRIKAKYPWAMQSYRRYHKQQLRRRYPKLT